MAQSSVTIATTARTQATPTLYNNLVNDVTELYSGDYETFKDGWIDVSDTWTYVDAQLVQVGDTSLYRPGFRVRWKQGAGYKYGWITEVGDFGVPLAFPAVVIGQNSDYTFANSAITDIQISPHSSPVDFPHIFETFAVLGSTAPMAISDQVKIYAYYQPLNGRTIRYSARLTFTIGGTPGADMFFNIPTYFVAGSAYDITGKMGQVSAIYKDGGNWTAGIGVNTTEKNAVIINKNDGGNWTAGTLREIEISGIFSY